MKTLAVRLTALLLLVATAAGCTTAVTGSASPGASPTAGGSPTPLVPSPSVAPSAQPSSIPSAETSPVTSSSPAAAIDAAWRELVPADAPSAREDHTWTVDPAARVGYLFGGRDGGSVRDDVWAFDLAADTWSRVRPENDGPSARFGHEAVWVDGLGVVVWAGQSGPTTFFDDLWAYDPGTNRWTRLPGDGDRPLARYGSCAAVGPDGRLWISHGFTEDGTRFADTRAYDFETRAWSDETPEGSVPVNRCLHGCWWTDEGELALYAGQTTGVQALGDLWTLAGAGTATGAWTRAEGDLPEDRNLYAFARHGDRMVVFGGRGLGNTFHRDVFALDGRTLAVEPVTPAGARPPGRAGGTLIDDAAGGRLLLFGGTSASRALGDTWELTLP